MIKKEILKSFSGKNVLITGGTGMIGRQIAFLLYQAGACIRVVSLDELCIHDQIEHLRLDLTDFSVCHQVTRDMDYVFHVAGIKGSAKVSISMIAAHFVPSLMMNTNVLEACRRNRVQKVVFTSSIGAYANSEVFKEGAPGNFNDMPMDFAGWSKRVAELQVHAYKVQYGIDTYSLVRPSNVYGPGDNFDPENAMIIGSLIARVHAGEKPVLVWGDGSAVRDLVFSKDVAEGTILALYHGTGGRYVNLGSGIGYSVREIVETLAGIVDFDYEFDKSKPSGYPKRVMDISLARQLIGYDPSTSLHQGLEQTWNWYCSNLDESSKKKNYFTETDHAN